MNDKHPDAELIKRLGGATRVAELLNLSLDKGGVQRVHNWTDRGIPAAVRLAHMDIFGEPTTPAGRGEPSKEVA